MNIELSVLVKMTHNGARCALSPARAADLIDRGLAERIREADMRPLELERHTRINAVEAVRGED